MRVQFTRPVASPGLSASAGQILDVPEDDALARIELGHCVAVDPAPKPRLRDRLPGRRKSEPKPKAAEDKPLDKLTVEQLKAYAEEQDISIPEDGKKADILAAITEALAQRAAPQE
ncbi:hypothetical protein SSP24_06140 [Streptomyces spinoverrucosus]|uniref:Uncharacterized protein n=1 Tax=Streptomyces spinoverrucosus TaxID=284043 RepID=A0A4Y3VBA0_9ACTN|nr:SAP domain-containing protein [Streptomyces spinoverrucosus]GEC02959.1 hypothetical protein SSP24_06140 [Streptomyces spinoverrucosus]GHB39282.1 hypothetical protein GCM10010397_06450 [Streptomyces spinoverrucosus]